MFKIPHKIMIILAKFPPSAPALGRLRHPFGKPSPSAAVKKSKKEKKRKKKLGRHGHPIFGAPGAPRLGRQLSLRRLQRR